MKPSLQFSLFVWLLSRDRLLPDFLYGSIIFGVFTNVADRLLLPLS